jgi:hypothetical protein
MNVTCFELVLYRGLLILSLFMFSLADVLFQSISSLWGYLQHIPVQMYLDCQFPYSFSLVLVWFPCSEQSLKHLNRVLSHILVRFVVLSSRYATHLCSVNTIACSIVHMVHGRQSGSVSPYDRRQPSHVYLCAVLSMTNVPCFFPQ